MQTRLEVSGLSIVALSHCFKAEHLKHTGKSYPMKGETIKKVF